MRAFLFVLLALILLAPAAASAQQPPYDLAPGAVLSQNDQSQIVVWQGQDWGDDYILPVGICAGRSGMTADPRMFELAWPRQQLGEWIPGAVSPEFTGAALAPWQCLSGWIAFPQPTRPPIVSFHRRPCLLYGTLGCGSADATWEQ